MYEISPKALVGLVHYIKPFAGRVEDGYGVRRDFFQESMSITRLKIFVLRRIVDCFGKKKLTEILIGVLDGLPSLHKCTIRLGSVGIHTRLLRHCSRTAVDDGVAEMHGRRRPTTLTGTQTHGALIRLC